MRYIVLTLSALVLFNTCLVAQTPVKKGLQIVDSLPANEMSNRNAVILRSELDSLIKQYNDSIVQEPVQVPVQENKSNIEMMLTIGLIASLVGLAVLGLLFYRHQQKINRMIAGFKPASPKKGQVVSFESRIGDLNAELQKLSKENEGMSRVIKEYNGIQHEYDSLKHGLAKAYKLNYYPGYDKEKAKTNILQNVLETEAAVNLYAYTNFFKPILKITDANKNSPAKISSEETGKLVELLVSLSLFYIEYLYLHVKELSIGGKMVERIHGFSNGQEPDLIALRKLDTEFGSRALVLRIALDRYRLQRLSYPIFDETNINPE